MKEKISITIDEDIVNKLRSEADYDARSLSQYINLILRRYLETEERDGNRSKY